MWEALCDTYTGRARDCLLNQLKLREKDIIWPERLGGFAREFGWGSMGRDGTEEGDVGATCALGKASEVVVVVVVLPLTPSAPSFLKS